MLSTDDEQGVTDLVARLHQLRTSRGLTIQQMAEACDLPKSTLESYMKSKGARRPGVDALISIARNMEVSLDWIVGISNSPEPYGTFGKRVVTAAYDGVADFLDNLIEAQGETDKPIIRGGKIGGFTAHRAAFHLALSIASRAGIFAPEDDAFRQMDAFVQDLGDRQPPTE